MVQLRTAHERDLTELASLAGELGYPLAPAIISANLLQIVARPEHCLLVACDAEDRAIAFLHAYQRISLASVPSVEIAGLVVAADWRGQGVGRRLIHALQDWARQQGVMVLRLRSNVQRDDAHRFYQQLGFRISKTQLALVKNL